MRFNQSGLEHLLFAGYLILFAWLVTKVGFFKNSGLTSAQLVIFFLLKVMAGIIYGWIGVYYGTLAQMVDTWAYHFDSLKETRLLKTNPAHFITSFFHNSYENGYSNFFESHESWWNDLKGNFFIKLLAIFNLFSFGNYYVNGIFYSFLSMFGPVAVFRIMNHVYPTKKIAVLLATFLIPSFLYWTSGLHKDGFIFVGLSLIIYGCYFGLKEKKISIKYIALVVLGFLLVLALRNFLIVILIPALAIWIIADKIKYRPILVFIAGGLLFILLFFLTGYLFPGLDFPGAVVKRQQEFLQLIGGSSVKVNPLLPTVSSFIVNAPQAFSLSSLRPYPFDVHHILSLAAAMEIDLVILLFLVFLFWRKNGIGLTSFILFCLFFSFGVLMMIGYAVNVLGAIVRYRSIVLPFFIIPMAANIDWGRINSLIFNNISNKNNI